MVVTGDPSQSDLSSDEPSGLAHRLRLIAPTDLALIHRFTNSQIVRNDLVAQIEALYSQEDGADLLRAA
jgi:phosphate starvation-inducible PhoH-like protein